MASLAVAYATKYLYPYVTSNLFGCLDVIYQILTFRTQSWELFFLVVLSISYQIPLNRFPRGAIHITIHDEILVYLLDSLLRNPYDSNTTLTFKG